MQKYSNNLADLRHQAGLSIQDLAYVIDEDKNYLEKIEQSKSDLTVPILIKLHILFKTPLIDMLADLYANQRAELIKRSEMLIAHLERKQHLKSPYRLQRVYKLINSLNHDDHDFVN